MVRYTMKAYNNNLHKYRFYISTAVSILCAAFAAFLVLALFSFNSLDNSWLYYNSQSTSVLNSMGKVGAHISALLLYVLGYAAYALAPLFLGVSYCLFFDLYDEEYDRVLLTPVTLLTIALICTMHMSSSTMFASGGLAGKFIWQLLTPLADRVTLLLCIYAFAATQALILTRTSLYQAVCYLYNILNFFFRYRHIWLVPPLRFVSYCTVMIGYACMWAVRHMYHALLRMLNISPVDARENEEGMTPVTAVKSYPYDQSTIQEDEEDLEEVVSPRVKKHKKTYKLPDNSVFAVSDKQQQNYVTAEHTHLATILEEKLSRFHVTGKVTKIKPGPVITLFEYQPDIDSKVSKILALEHDLALALEAMSVRIVAPIPGTSRVGFEVANKERKSVKMGDICKSPAFAQSRAYLPLILGQDTSGENIVVDLIDMPHLLVAGSTGSGKSIALNVMLTSLLCKLSPEQLRIIIIDPKRLEFCSYQDIAHLLFPIITDPRRAAPVTQWLVKTMEDRYEMMSHKGVKNILDYKRMCEKTGEVDELPFIVFIIDELADLMMVSGKDIEGSIARLAQMARAAGIHLIIATQRPSVDVITGVIKVNFPSRISFRVSSKIDSRTIIDTGGAELLLGKGDMLFMDAHSARIKRVHGAYISDAEITSIVGHIHGQAQVQYIDLQEAIAAYQSTQNNQDYDELLPEVIRFLSELDDISISLLQRKFKIGYNRSASIIELLESQGKILPANGSKMRKVIK